MADVNSEKKHTADVGTNCLSYQQKVFLVRLPMRRHQMFLWRTHPLRIHFSGYTLFINNPVIPDMGENKIPNANKFKWMAD